MNDFVRYLYHIVRFPFVYLVYRIKVLRDVLEVNRSDDFFRRKKLILSHDLKGGTNTYLKSIDDDETIVLKNCEFIWHLCYKIEISGKSFYITDQKMRKLLSSQYAEIIINSLVKMKQLNKVFLLLENNKLKYSRTKLTYLVHDYHSICPSFNLINKHEYCQLKCEDCNYKQPVVYGSMKNIDVREWRINWSKIFDLCDEIRCFSNSSKRIISTVYSSVYSKITVIPHDVVKLKGEFEPQNRDELIVGFFGIINNDAKGISQTRKILEKIINYTKVVFIGSTKSEIGVIHDNITYTGRYNHDNLISIMNEHSVNLAIFPSVTPETFSYMVSELIQTGILILSFDIGAQGEKVKKYYNGKVFQTCEDMVNYIASLVERT